nr:MAG TPA: hypothetical protein [Caudoviricetes sp.]
MIAVGRVENITTTGTWLSEKYKPEGAPALSLK